MRHFVHLYSYLHLHLSSITVQEGATSDFCLSRFPCKCPNCCLGLWSFSFSAAQASLEPAPVGFPCKCPNCCCLPLCSFSSFFSAIIAVHSSRTNLLSSHFADNCHQEATDISFLQHRCIATRQDPFERDPPSSHFAHFVIRSSDVISSRAPCDHDQRRNQQSPTPFDY